MSETTRKGAVGDALPCLLSAFGLADSAAWVCMSCSVKGVPARHTSRAHCAHVDLTRARYVTERKIQVATNGYIVRAIYPLVFGRSELIILPERQIYCLDGVSVCRCLDFSLGAAHFFAKATEMP